MHDSIAHGSDSSRLRVRSLLAVLVALVPLSSAAERLQVKNGSTVKKAATLFGVEPATLLRANPGLRKGSDRGNDDTVIPPGTVLTVPNALLPELRRARLAVEERPEAPVQPVSVALQGGGVLKVGGDRYDVVDTKGRIIGKLRLLGEGGQLSWGVGSDEAVLVMSDGLPPWLAPRVRIANAFGVANRQVALDFQALWAEPTSDAARLAEAWASTPRDAVKVASAAKKDLPLALHLTSASDIHASKKGCSGQRGHLASSVVRILEASTAEKRVGARWSALSVNEASGVLHRVADYECENLLMKDPAPNQTKLIRSPRPR